MQRTDYIICNVPFPEIAGNGIIDYEILINDSIVYRGRAFSNKNAFSINIRKIVEDYLGAKYLDIASSALTVQAEGDGFAEVEVRTIDGESTSTVVWYGILRAYDGRWEWNGDSATLSEPINGKIDERMQLLYSVYRATAEEGINYGIVPEISITPAVINANAMSGRYPLTIISNVPYSVITDSEWFSAEQEGDTWIVVVEDNTGETRTGTLSVIYEDEFGRQQTAVISVVQAEPFIEVSPSVINATAVGNVYSFTVTSNMPYTISEQSDWVELSAYSGASGTTEFTATVSDNSEYSARTAVISVGTKTLTINQEQASITVVPTSIEASAVEGVYQLDVISNIPFTATSDSSWITLSPSTGYTGETAINVHTEYNSGTAERTGSITIGNNTVVITQAAEAIIVEPEDLLFGYEMDTETFSVTAATSYTISTSADWITLSASSGSSGVSTYTVTANGNYGGEERTAAITVGDKTIGVTQAMDANLQSYFKFKSANGQVAIVNNSTSACDEKGILEWSTGGNQWTRIYSGQTASFQYSGWVYLRGKKGSTEACATPPSIIIGSTVATNSLTIAGNILSLAYGENFRAVTGETDLFIGILLRNDAVIKDAYSVVMPQVSGVNAFYAGEFMNFTGLETAPVLFTKVLKENEYRRLFSGCTNLNYIKCLATDISASGCTDNWVSGVAPLGLFVKAKGMNDWTVGENGIPNGWIAIEEGGIDAVASADKFDVSGGTITVTAGCESNYAISTDADWVTLSASSGSSGITVFTVTAPALDGADRTATVHIGSMSLSFAQAMPDYSKEYLTIEALSSGQIPWNVSSTGSTAPTWSGLPINYSVNDGEWQTLSPNSSITVSRGDKIRLKGNALRYSASNSVSANFCNFGSTDNVISGTTFNVYGNIMSVLDGDSFTASTEIGATALKYFFRAANVISAENLYIPFCNLHSANRMFLNCYHLTTAPKILPATTLGRYCYQAMFDGCTQIERAPYLPATTDAEGCYQRMFRYCNKLNYISCNLVEQNFSNSLTDWTNAVADNGIFAKNENAAFWTRGTSGIPRLWVIEGDSYIVVSPNSVILDETVATSFTVSVSASTNYTISTNDSWISPVGSSGTAGNRTFRINIAANTGSDRNGSVLFSGDGISATLSIQQAGVNYDSKYFTLKAVSAGTIDYNDTNTNARDISYSLNEGSWVALSNGDSITVSVDDEVRFKGTNNSLAETMSAHTYFSGTAVIDAFGNILSLLNGDNFYGSSLPGTQRAIGGLFLFNTNIRSCKNLSLPNEVVPYIYAQMFRGCTSLVDAPALPAATLANSCYFQMFYGCTSLTTGPELPAASTVNNCYRQIFGACTQINYVKCLATSLTGTNATQYWLNSAPSTGTFVGYSSAGWTTGGNGVPQGWTFVEYNT